MMLLCSLFIHVEGMCVKAGILALLLEIVIRIWTETIMNFRLFCLDLDLVLFYLNFWGIKAPRKMSLGWMLMFAFLLFFHFL